MTLTTGLGFKAEHREAAFAARARGLWFEVHAENYMVEGGPRRAMLMALRDRFPVSLHGVGLSLASVEPPSPDHLARLRALIDAVEPVLVSDHLAWQKWRGAHHADFLPFPRTHEALAVTGDNIARVQDAIGRTILVENPSLYVGLPGHELPEAEFMAALAARTGCGIVLDVNNVFVSAHNIGASAGAALDAFPAHAIGEIHLAGHDADPDPDTDLLIDTHGAAVADPVWALYDRLIERIGPRPTLVEWDNDVPEFAVLMGQRACAERVRAAHACADA